MLFFGCAWQSQQYETERKIVILQLNDMYASESALVDSEQISII